MDCKIKDAEIWVVRREGEKATARATEIKAPRATDFIVFWFNHRLRMICVTIWNLNWLEESYLREIFHLCPRQRFLPFYSQKKIMKMQRSYYVRVMKMPQWFSMPKVNGFLSVLLVVWLLIRNKYSIFTDHWTLALTWWRVLES